MIKRRAGYVLSRVDTASENLAILKAFFEDGHPDYVAYIDTLGVGLALWRDEFANLCERAWGHVPDVVARWTATGQDYKESKRE